MSQQTTRRTPAFQLNRFKGTVHMVMNLEMGDDLLSVLDGAGNDLPRWLYAFRQKLRQKLETASYNNGNGGSEEDEDEEEQRATA